MRIRAGSASLNGLKELIFEDKFYLANGPETDPARYSLTETTINPVPLPASGLLLVDAFAALLLGRRRRRATV